jgi:hypothetical protein
MYPSKNFNLCLFYASEQAKVQKKATKCIYYLSRPPHFRPHPGGGVGWQWGWGESCKPAKIGPVCETAWRFGPEDLVKTKFIIIYLYMFKEHGQGFLNLLKNLKSLH